MAGIFGNNPFDIARERELDRYLDELDSRNIEQIKGEAETTLNDLLADLEEVTLSIDENLDISLADELQKAYEIIDSVKDKL